MIEPATAVTARDEAGAMWIAVAGPIDLATAPAVEADISALVGNETAVVTLDLSDVDYLDSAGLRVLFRLTTRLAEVRTALEVVAPPGSISRRVLDLCGYTEVGTLRP
jgi:anti-anti-sigma factor